jgi:hypothetical protein
MDRTTIAKRTGNGLAIWANVVRVRRRTESQTARPSGFPVSGVGVPPDSEVLGDDCRGPGRQDVLQKTCDVRRETLWLPAGLQQRH